MSAADKLSKWVEKKPMILACFDETFSESLLNSSQGFEHLTIVKQHSVFQNFKLPTLCWLEIQVRDATKCYLGTATRMTAVSTFDSRLTIKKLRSVVPSSLQKIEERITDARMKSLLNGRLPRESGFSILSPKLSAQLIHLLEEDPENSTAMDVALSLLPGLRRTSHNNWAQEDAIHSAMDVFGIRINEMPNEVVLKQGSSSGLALIGSYLGV